MSGVVARRRDDINLSIRQAHMTAVLGRVEKIEPVEKYLIGSSESVSSEAPAGQAIRAWAAVAKSMGHGVKVG